MEAGFIPIFGHTYYLNSLLSSPIISSYVAGRGVGQAPNQSD